MSPSRLNSSPSAIPVLTVRTADGRGFSFGRPFDVGREFDCDVRVDDAQVSRKHLMVAFEDGQWWLHDQQSGNGVFVNGRRVENAPIDRRLTIRLGAGGPLIVMEVESRAQPAKQSPAIPSAAGDTMFAAQRYFESSTDEGPVGPRTQIIRKAFQRVQQKQKRRYRSIIAVVVLAGLCAGGYAYYGHRRLLQQEAIAQGLFYDMKTVDVEIATLEQQLAAAGNSQERILRFREQRRQLQASYDQYVSGLNLYDHKLTPQEQIILRITRMFGECELAAPPVYLAEVATYIRKWQSTPRYAQAVKRAQQLGYTRTIVEELQKQDLPPQYFYLAMQESSFDELAIGDRTRWGIAKGMWQFIPDTARRFGLTVGPLAGFQKADPADDRHKWDKSTHAAALYIKDIYATDAQASGLLVMASYNWGEHRIIDLLRTMPSNPRERNFWKVLERHHDQVPKQTYDYVLSIVSAAVIGENPRLFGFGFDNPLMFADRPAEPVKEIAGAVSAPGGR